MSRIVAGGVTLILMALTACAERPAEIGVDVFSADTLPARVSVVVAGTLEIGLRAERMHAGPGRTIVLETPVTLVIQRGEGFATVTSFDSTQRIVVQPAGTPPDSADVVGATGVAVTFSRVGDEPRVSLKVEKP